MYVCVRAYNAVTFSIFIQSFSGSAYKFYFFSKFLENNNIM